MTVSGVSLFISLFKDVYQMPTVCLLVKEHRMVSQANVIFFLTDSMVGDSSAEALVRVSSIHEQWGSRAQSRKK
jgi:hypothetical protein